MIDYFAELDFDRTLSINEKVLEEKYFSKSREFHPDFHSNKNEDEKKIILEKSSIINSAYKALKNIYSRAKHLIELEWQDIPLAEQKKIPPMLLMEVMEMQDKISEFHTAQDVHKTRLSGELKVIETNLKIKEKELKNEFANLALEWEKVMRSSFDQKVSVLKNINLLINTKKYIGTLLATIDNELYGGEPITH